MKAYVLHGIGDLRYEEVQLPVLKEDEVLLEVMAAGICGSDIPRIFETGTYHFPTIPGHEFAGVIREVGSHHYDNLIGQRAGVFPLIPCMTCSSCLQQDYEMCKHYNYLGSRTDGGFAEYVAVPVWNLLRLPDNITYEEAAILEPMSVALHAIRQISVKDVNTVAIYGAGPIGMLMAMWTKTLGIDRTLIIANKQQQVTLARRLGFDEVCDSYVTDDSKWIADQTNGEGVDVAIDGVGTGVVLGKCIAAAGLKGNIIAVGNPKSDLSLDRAIYWNILRKQLRLYGTWNSRYGCDKDNDWQMAVEALRDRKMAVDELITHKLDFDDLETGLMMMKERREFSCKIMITKGRQNG